MEIEESIIGGYYARRLLSILNLTILSVIISDTPILSLAISQSSLFLSCLARAANTVIPRETIKHDTVAINRLASRRASARNSLSARKIQQSGSAIRFPPDNKRPPTAREGANANYRICRFIERIGNRNC